jgi:archaemetzincin
MRVFVTVICAAIFLVSCVKDDGKRIIGIQVMGSVDFALSDSISNSLQKVYGLSVVRLSTVPMPKEAFVNIKTPRYRADKILRITKKTKPDSLDYVLVVTNADISTTVRDRYGRIEEPRSKYEDWGIFGLGYQPGSACVVSTFRLAKNCDQKTFMERIRKVSVHEVGHNLGLDHCTSARCVMRDAAEKIATVDNETLALCDVNVS